MTVDLAKVYLSPNETDPKKQDGVIRQLLENAIAQTDSIYVPPSNDTSGATDFNNITQAMALANSKRIPRIRFGSGQYYINSPIFDSYNNLSFEGAGTIQDGSTGTLITPTYSNNSIFTLFDITGWGIKNLSMQTNVGGGSKGIYVNSCQNGMLHNVEMILTGPSDIGLHFDAEVANTNVVNNYVNQLTVFASTGSTSTVGLFLSGSTAPASPNTTGNVFVLYTAELTAASQVGIYLKNCDTNTFIQTTIFGTSPNLGATSVQFDYGGTTGAGWPSNHAFYTFDDGFNMAQPAMVVAGTPLTGVKNTNIFYNASAGNLSGSRGFVPNVEWYGPGVQGISQTIVTASSLTSAAAGAKAIISNGSTGAILGTTITTGNPNNVTVPVFYDGTSWRYG